MLVQQPEVKTRPTREHFQEFNIHKWINEEEGGKKEDWGNCRHLLNGDLYLVAPEILPVMINKFFLYSEAALRVDSDLESEPLDITFKKRPWHQMANKDIYWNNAKETLTSFLFSSKMWSFHVEKTQSTLSLWTSPDWPQSCSSPVPVLDRGPFTPVQTGQSRTTVMLQSCIRAAEQLIFVQCLLLHRNLQTEELKSNTRLLKSICTISYSIYTEKKKTKQVPQKNSICQSRI